ncbi:MAG TPA: DNA gyrase subunit A [Thermodesulfobacteriota bacterium]|nr:DNA gyrase subunit A [Thermodesulfobacteriota bacterium]
MQENQQVTTINIEDEMRRSYLDYAMSVIVGRALPDVRDGLKPVHRRILFAMNELGNTHDKPYKKSARIVGDVIGKYHPHGDVAVYDSIVRMAQDFSMRCPLIDGQGNFGSVDGDSAAAMRYTEIRMSKLAEELLEDIDKDTVDFGPNYDDSLVEPLVLPARYPNLLVNGSGGIAVGMATNIPPHNLKEIIEGTIDLINNPDITIPELMAHIPGPDFPTAGFIHGKEGIAQAYMTGRGIIQMRARTVIEKKKGEREVIVVTELPYQVNKARLIEKIAELVRDKKIEGISDLRDESDREGMRIVIELKKDEMAGAILNQLYKFTSMQDSFGIINLSIVDGQPRVLTLKETLQTFIKHRKEVVTRRTVFDLRKAEAKAHILEGLKIALENLDEVIAIIKGATSPKDAQGKLIERFRFTEIQAQAILDMKLQRLTGLERDKIMDEHRETLRLIERLKEILGSERLILNIIVDELREIRDKYGDDRRTEIIELTKDISIEDMITEEDMVVTVSHTGYIKRNPLSIYRSQHRGGKGRTGMATKEEDFVEHLFVASTHSYILFFTSIGKVYWLKVHELPLGGPTTKGKAIVNLLSLAPGETITAMLPVREFSKDRNIVMGTKNGVVKKSDLMAYSNPRTGGIIALNLDEGDSLVAVDITDGSKDIILSTRHGKAIRFKEEEVREIGRVGRGVKGIVLEDDDEIVSMQVIAEGTTILTATENGYGKRTDLTEYPIRHRGGKGVITIKTSKRNGNVVSVLQVTDEDDLMMITSNGKVVRTGVKGISVIGRNTQGVKLIWVEGGEKVVGVARLAEKEEEEKGE